MKKIFFSLFIYLNFLVNFVFAKAPEPTCEWLPFCWDSDAWKTFAKWLTDETIAIVAVLAVFWLMFSGIYYLISAWNEEKTWKAKKWMIWALVWVFLSISSWGIVKMINGINFSF